MGSFNVSCGISNLSINEGDRIGFIMLMDAPAGYRSNGPTGATMRIYADDLYHPYLPPVFGTYGDYGRIENLEESVTTRLIEKIFHRPAVDVVNAIGSGRDPYSDYGTIAPLYMKDPKSSHLNEWGVDEKDALESVGFLNIGEGVYKYGDFALTNLALNTWTIMTKTGEIERKSFRVSYLEEAVSIFAETTGLFPGMDQEDVYAVQTIQKMHGMFFLKEVFEEIEPKIVEEDTRESISASWKEFQDSLEAIEKDPLSLGMMRSLRPVEKKSFPLDRVTELRAYKDSDEFALIDSLIVILTATNHLLQPNLNGEQDGNDPASKTLAKISLKVLDDRRRKWDDEDD